MSIYEINPTINITEDGYNAVIREITGKGPAGDPGPVGPAGPKGDTGDIGLQGMQGIKGDIGAQGLAGMAGQDGAKPNTVLSGFAAPALALGNDGDFYIDTDDSEVYGPKTAGVWGTGVSLIGAQGEQGVKGDTGDAGPQGIKGDTGATGPASTVPGSAGNDGYTPVKGVDYFDGATGADGAVGAQGIQGPTGSQGAQGLQGEAGSDGDDSIVVGPLGPQGLPGAQGLKGDTGNAGAGVPTGGTAGQQLQKIDGVDYNTVWVTVDPDFADKGNVSGVVALSYVDGSVQRMTAIAAISSLSITDWPASGTKGQLILYIDMASDLAVTFGGVTGWSSGAPPILKTGLNELVFTTIDGGSKVIGHATALGI